MNKNKISPKFRIGDTLLIKIKSTLVGNDIWVGKILEIEDSSYTIKCLSSDIHYYTRIPFLFDEMLELIAQKDINKTIKAIQILYNS